VEWRRKAREGYSAQAARPLHLPDLTVTDSDSEYGVGLNFFINLQNKKKGCVVRVREHGPGFGSVKLSIGVKCQVSSQACLGSLDT